MIVKTSIEVRDETEHRVSVLGSTLSICEMPNVAFKDIAANIAAWQNEGWFFHSVIPSTSLISSEATLIFLGYCMSEQTLNDSLTDQSKNIIWRNGLVDSFGGDGVGLFIF